MKKDKTNAGYFIFLFFSGSILGWLWEMIAFKCTHDGFGWIQIIQNLRGVLHGPWVPIYGFGCILLVVLGQKLRQRPIMLLFSNIVTCGLLEYSTSYILEYLFHARWWDYSTKFLNLNGRIYVSGLLFFGVAGMVVVYLIEPWLRSRIMRIHPRIKTVFATFLVIAFLLDTLIALKFPNLELAYLLRGEDKMKTITILLTKYSDWISNLVYHIGGRGYTHASLALGEDENTYYSFNYHGFCVETLEKHRRRGVKKSLCYRLNVPDDAYEKIKIMIGRFKTNRFDFQYTRIGVLFCVLKIPFKWEKHYWC